MSSSASNSKAAESSKAPEQPTQEPLPHVGVLEEDDEFEEFPVAGTGFDF
jgi:26 proteasome complex subunit DSS1